MGFLGFVFSNVAYHFGSVLNEKAENFRKLWAVHYRSGTEKEAVRFRSIVISVQARYMLCVIRSCRDLKINVGHFYYFDRTTVSTYISIIISNTIGLLLAF